MGGAGEAEPGTFIPTDDLMADLVRAEDLDTRLIRRTKAEGGLRADVEVDDLSLILEQVASLRLGDERLDPPSLDDATSPCSWPA